MTLGTLIRNARRSAALSQPDLARHLGVTVSYLSHIEHDRAQPSDTVLDTLSVVLGVPADDLYVAAGRLGARTLDYIQSHPELLRALRQSARQQNTAALIALAEQVTE